MADFLSHHSTPTAPPTASTSFESCDFREFHDRHYDFVRRNLRRLGLSEAMADDGTQEVFLRLHAKLDEYRGDAPERAWVYGFVRRVAALMRRTEARRDRKHQAMHEAATPLGDIRTQRQSPAATEQLLVEELFAKLDARDREVLTLVDVEGVSGPELAAMQGIELSRAYNSIRMARRRARAALEQMSARPKLQSAMLSPAFVSLIGQSNPEASLTPLLAKTLGAGSTQAARDLAWTQLVAAKTKAGLALGATSGAVAATVVPPAVVKTVGVALGVGLGLGLGVGGDALVKRVRQAEAPVAQSERVVVADNDGPRTKNTLPSQQQNLEQGQTAPSAGKQPNEPSSPATAPSTSATPLPSRTSTGPDATADKPAVKKASRKRRPSVELPPQVKAPAHQPQLERSKLLDKRLSRETQLLESALLAYDQGRHHDVLALLNQADSELGKGVLTLERKSLRQRSECHIAQDRGQRLGRRCDQLKL